MSILHPYFIIVLILLLIGSFNEVYKGKVNKGLLWGIGAFLIILAGLRDSVGPDYGSYRGIYSFSFMFNYEDILKNGIPFYDAPALGLEWLYLLINKFFLDVFNAPFYVVTLFFAMLAIPLKLKFTLENTFYPFTFLALIFIPNFFIGESGQMRQNLSSLIVYFAIRYIKEDKLLHYLFFIYIAGGIHNVGYAFLPMYWLARFPLNKFLMASLIIASIIASPFEIYRVLGGFLDGIAADNSIVMGFNGYMDETSERAFGAFGMPEAIMLMFSFFLFYYDNKMKARFPYYEYHRNYIVIGICLYFILRSNPILGSRLAGAFVGLGYLLLPNAMSVVSETHKKTIHMFIVFLIFFNFVVFSSFNNIKAGRFTIDLYRNHILPD